MADTDMSTTTPASAAATVDTRHQHLNNALGSDTFAKVRSAKVLVVGAGGIGCELLKNLVLSGFKDIHIIDLDTIDLSNLNRQFLFRKHHIGMSKAKIARESVLKYANSDDVSIIAHHADIKTTEFGPNYFEQFDLVMNALDNLSARRHVNRVCLSVNVPLIESGTAGYLGQVTVIRKGLTECFECTPKVPPKEFAVCTIRSNPSAPIHCIVWAKMLFGRLFGVPDDTNAVTDMSDNVVEGDVATGTAIRDELLPQEQAKGYHQWVFHKLFHTDIDRLARMGDLWKERKPPVPLLLANIDTMVDGESQSTQTQQKKTALKDQIVLSFKENVQLFIDTINKLKLRNEQEGHLTWDKDDDMALNFVVAASNIRSHIFGIPTKSKFDIKAMAGNIVPAIATTNAIISGLIVMEAFKVLGGRYDQCRSTYLYKVPSGKRLLLPAELDKPKADCYVCSQKFITLKINTLKTTLAQLVNDVLKKALSFHDPMLTVGASLLYEGGDEDLTKEEIEARNKLEQKIIAEYKMPDNTILNVEDYLQNFKVSILISHCETFESEEKWFDISGKQPVPGEEKAVQTTTTTTTTTTAKVGDQKIDLDDVEIIESIDVAPPSTKEPVTETRTHKRKEQEPDEQLDNKKQRQ
ncbi:hypothetical protein SAMD00019534_053670, partial [Acytostelium subglobosum LB1]|uniref:hypothetical protein n=1 Tax=Acytostelium subglobosum LB1 TaxID=1410327 RepID=UPI000644C86E